MKKGRDNEIMNLLNSNENKSKNDLSNNISRNVAHINHLPILWSFLLNNQIIDCLFSILLLAKNE